ncbi:MAG: IclR family transcriptional regulator [Humibacillus sp.]|nr:IclR family transcriptional regulator [Humibacillus sp.]MDN5778774.1 IclR family transcriptional regulator [Humibacillus sp.]
MTTPAEPNRRSGVQSIDRAVRLLELLAEAGGSMRLNDLAEATGLPQPTIHRLLRALVANGHVCQDASRQYALGPRLIRLGQLAGDGLAARAQPFLVELVELTGETAAVAVLERDQATFVAQVPSDRPLAVYIEAGEQAPAHCTGVGRALLSQGSDTRVRELLARTGTPALTPDTVTDIRALLTQLAAVRQAGWTQDSGEYQLGVRCIAAPVPGLTARVALSISGPQSRLDDEAANRVGPVVRQIAAEFSRMLLGGATLSAVAPLGVSNSED